MERNFDKKPKELWTDYILRRLDSEGITKECFETYGKKEPMNLLTSMLRPIVEARPDDFLRITGDDEVTYVYSLELNKVKFSFSIILNILENIRGNATQFLDDLLDFEYVSISAEDDQSVAFEIKNDKAKLRALDLNFLEKYTPYGFKYIGGTEYDAKEIIDQMLNFFIDYYKKNNRFQEN